MQGHGYCAAQGTEVPGHCQEKTIPNLEDTFVENTLIFTDPKIGRALLVSIIRPLPAPTTPQKNGFAKHVFLFSLRSR